MKKLIPLALLLFYNGVYGQYGLYAIKVVYQPNERILVKVDVKTANIQPVKNTSVFDWYIDDGNRTIDQKNGILYFKTSNNTHNNYKLLGIDLRTGNIVSSVNIRYDDIHQMIYNCYDSTLYAIQVNYQPNTRHLIKINPKTGVITKINDSSIFDWYTTYADRAIDPINKVIYFVTNVTDIKQKWLSGYSLIDGSLVSYSRLKNADDIHQMVYNYQDQTLYGIKVNYEPNERHLVKIDPLTANVYPVNNNSLFDWYITGGKVTIDEYNGIFYAIVTDNKKETYRLMGIDIESGNILSDVPLNNKDDIHQMIFNPLPHKIEIKVENTCVGTNTKFKAPKAAFKATWDFGDTANNYSNELNPEHKFTKAGNYRIKLIYDHCCGTDSIIKYISITDENIQVQLPNDTVLCLKDSIILDVSSYGNSFVWNDSSTSDKMVVKSSGVYIVKELKCNSIDSIKVDYIDSTKFNLGPDIDACIGDSIILKSNIINTPLLWSDSSNADSMVVLKTGKFWIKNDGFYCNNSDTIQVVFHDIPSVNLGNDTTLCKGDTLNINLKNSTYHYKWSNGSTSGKLDITNSNTYYLTVANKYCKYFDSINVKFHPIPILGLKDTTIGCIGNSVELDVTNTNSSYSWSDGSSLSKRSFINNKNIRIEVSNEHCSVIDSTKIVFYEVPNIDLGKDTTLCTGQILILESQNTSNSHIWNTNSISSSIIVNQTGTYWLIEKNQYCESSDSINILFLKQPIVNLGNDTVLCENERLELIAGNEDFNYKWNDFSSSSTKRINSAGTYSVEVTNKKCIDSDTIVIGYKPNPTISLGNDTTLCEGDKLNISVFDKHTDKYNWSNNSHNHYIEISEGNQYWVEVERDNCVVIDSINVEFIPNIDIDDLNDTTLCKNEVYKILILDTNKLGNSIKWQDGTTNNTYIIDESGYYTISIDNICGYMSKSFEVSFINCNCTLGVPNIFTPNDDDYNNVFKAKTDCELEQFTAHIYNRWGNTISISNNPEKIWDGRYKGYILPAGDYSFSINEKLKKLAVFI